jgi:hypothetical protein
MATCARRSDEQKVEKYTLEVLFGLMSMLLNITLIVSCAWTTVRLYEMSRSWHCLWALLMLLLMRSRSSSAIDHRGLFLGESGRYKNRATVTRPGNYTGITGERFAIKLQQVKRNRETKYLKFRAEISQRASPSSSTRNME